MATYAEQMSYHYQSPVSQFFKALKELKADEYAQVRKCLPLVEQLGLSGKPQWRVTLCHSLLKMPAVSVAAGACLMKLAKAWCPERPAEAVWVADLAMFNYYTGTWGKHFRPTCTYTIGRRITGYYKKALADY